MDWNDLRTASARLTIYTVATGVGLGSVGGYFGGASQCFQQGQVTNVCQESPFLPIHENHGEPSWHLHSSTAIGSFSMIDMNHVATAT